MTTTKPDLPAIATRFFDALVRENKPNYPLEPHKAMADPQYCFGMMTSIIGDVEREVTNPAPKKETLADFYFSDDFVAETRQTLKDLRDMDYAAAGLLQQDGDMFNSVLTKISPKGSPDMRNAMLWRIKQANEMTAPLDNEPAQYVLAELEHDLVRSGFPDLAGEMTRHSAYYQASGKDRGWGYR